MPQPLPLGPGAPRVIGSYRLTGLLGRGGQGAVYLGEAPDGGPVAVKVLHEGAAGSEDAMRRFLREVEAARRVAPFCTARVLDAGVHGERPYIVSEFVPGRSLELLVQEEGPRRGGALQRLAVTTSSALAAIHRAGIVHRDFKPANVVLGPEGPVVIDFGIARALDQAGTRTGSVGTPAYMAPEQFTDGAVGQPADIFAWAGTMVFAATGRRPFPGDTMPALLNAILHQPPDVSGLPEPLAGIVALCLDKDPRSRPTADELHARLSGHAPAPTRPAEADRPGPATSPLPPERPARRRTWPLPVAAGLAAVTFTAFLLWPDGEKRTGGTVSPSARPSFGQLVHPPLIDHGNDIRSIAVGTVDGSAVAVTGSDDQTVRVWDLATGRTLGAPLRGHTYWVQSVAFGVLRGSPIAVSASDDDTVRVWSLADRSLLGVFEGHDGDVKTVATGELGSRPIAVSGSADASLRIWDLEDQQEIARLTGHRGAVAAVALTELDGVLTAVSAGDDGTVRIWDLPARRQVASLTGHEGWVRSVALTRLDGRPVAVTGGLDGTIRVWDLLARRQVGEPMRGHVDSVRSITAGAAAGTTLVISGGEDRTVRVWDLAARDQIESPFTGHTDRVWSVAFTDLAGTPMALSGSRDNTLRLWSLAR
ncbi:protein kinase [Actinocorallia sp. B10E7]|uniref:serine/threonine-protein kinase n=1 Tax=Actinocorallia sp. B10E7 TaxID=3153558 RepID=UPI00325D5DF5